MSANVYYSIVDNNNNKLDIKNLWSYFISLRVSKNDINGKDIFFCPSVRERMQRTFFIPSPVEQVFGSKNSTRFCVGLNGLYHVMLPYSLLMFSEVSVVASVTNPFFHLVSDINSIVVPAAMDISKWYRPFIFSYLSKNNTVCRLIGEPLLYVEFDKHVSLFEYERTSELNNLVSKPDRSLRKSVTGNNKYVSLNNTYLESSECINKTIIKLCKDSAKIV
jgi:hypothetical protein